ncbi:MAG: hypothetical protein JW795_24105, partial [Chitinivibrionales bacterium]|nr:hypothetical protein [Chitinivibrionales bacterium]
QVVVAAIRAEVAREYDVPMLQISFKKALDECRNLFWLLFTAKDMLTAEQIHEITERSYRNLMKQASKPRRRN